MYEGMTYQGGANVLHGLRWAVEAIIPEEIRRRVALGWVPPESGAGLDLDTVLAHLPLADHPLLLDLTPFYDEWLAHPTADAYWHPISPCAGYEQINAPALNISGWYDIFPRFARNSNAGGEFASETAGQYLPAINRIFHDTAHPSRLIFPIIER
jgi:predicted acyl esterase